MYFPHLCRRQECIVCRISSEEDVKLSKCHVQCTSTSHLSKLGEKKERKKEKAMEKDRKKEGRKKERKKETNKQTKKGKKQARKKI